VVRKSKTGRFRLNSAKRIGQPRAGKFEELEDYKKAFENLNVVSPVLKQEIPTKIEVEK